MPRTLLLEIETPGEVREFLFPKALDKRLQSLLDKQDNGGGLTAEERKGAEGLAPVSRTLSWLRLRSERMARSSGEAPLWMPEPRR